MFNAVKHIFNPKNSHVLSSIQRTLTDVRVCQIRTLLNAPRAVVQCGVAVGVIVSSSGGSETAVITHTSGCFKGIHQSCLNAHSVLRQTVIVVLSVAFEICTNLIISVGFVS